MKTKFLFPNRFKQIGWILLIPSALLGIYLVVNLGKGPIFPKSLNILESNYTRTIVGVLFIIAAILVAFSKEKHEDEFISKIRLESLVWATYINYAILIFCFLFFFEWNFIYVMIFNMFTILIFFIARFNFLLNRMNKSLNHEK
jgi:FlaA1/EpsC-like NDP-sugar epimerase